MERARFIEHKEKKIFVLDFSNCQPAEMPALIDECARQVQSQPDKSVYTITVTTGAKYDFDTVDKLKRLTKENLIRTDLPLTATKPRDACPS